VLLITGFLMAPFRPSERGGKRGTSYPGLRVPALGSPVTDNATHLIQCLILFFNNMPFILLGL